MSRETMIATVERLLWARLDLNGHSASGVRIVAGDIVDAITPERPSKPAISQRGRGGGRVR